MANFPGMNPSGPPLPSGDPLIPSSLIDAHTLDRIKDAITGSQMQAISSQPGAEGVMTRLVEKMLIETARKTMERMDKTPSGHRKISELADRLAREDAGLGTPAASALNGPPSASPHSSMGRIAPPPAAPAAKTLRQQYSEGRQMTMGSLARQVSGAVATSISQKTSNWTQLEDGTLQQVLPDPTDPQGLRTIPDPNGRTVRPGEPGYEHTLRTVTRGKMLSNALEKISTGDPALTGRLGMMAGKIAGGIGIGVTAIQKTGQFFESQNTKAAPYRAAFGGEGTGMFAARERMGEFTAGLEGFGTIGGSRAREDYRRASGLGLRGGQRGAATDFSRTMAMRYGMGSGDAFQIVQQAIEEGNISLDDYAQSIRKVTKVAVDSGKSAADAIQQLVSAQHALAQQGISGGTGLAIAQGATASVSAMDRETASAFGGASGLASSALSQRAALYSAAVSGQDPAAAMFRSQFGGAGAAAQAQANIKTSAADLVTRIASYLNVSPERIRREAKGITNSERQSSLLVDWAGGDTRRAEYAVQQIMGLLPLMGYQPKNPADGLRIFFALVGGSVSTGSGEGLSGTDRITGHKDSYGHMESYQKVDPNSVGSAGVSQHNQSAFVAGGGRMGRASAEYLSMVDKTGAGSASIEGLLSNKADKELKAFTGHGLDDSKMFIVRDAHGNNKKVSWSTVMSNASYRAQLADNSALIQGKGHEQMRVSDLSKVDTSKSGKTSQKVEIAFTGAAERLLKVSGPTDYERAGMPSGTTYNPDSSPTYSGQ